MCDVVAANNKGRTRKERACVLRHPSFVAKAGNRTPDSVLMPPSLSAPLARAAPGLAGVTHPRRRGGDASERGGTNALRLPHDKPAPRTLLLIGQRSRLAAGIAADAGSPSHYPFTHYRGDRRWARSKRNILSPIASCLSPWLDCSLLPSCVAAALPPPRPCLLFRRVAFLRELGVES
jgi:hypothetical protein